MAAAKHQDTFKRLFERLEAVERGIVGTPEQPGLAARVEIMRTDFDGKLTRLSDKVGINNWLTGSIMVIIIGQIIFNIFKG